MFDGNEVGANNPMPVTNGAQTGTAGTPNAAVTTVQGITAGTPVIVAGAGTAGSPGTAVQTIQGITNGTSVPVLGGGYTTSQQSTPTVQAASYSAGNCVGALISLTTAARVAAGSGLIQSVTATFSSGVLPSLDVIFFNANPSGSTTTDKTAVAIATADLGKVVGVAHLTDTTLLGASSPSVIQSQQQAIPFVLPSGQTLYAAVVTRTAITLTSTSDMILTVRILQD
jgi:hypothetical protein